MTYQMRIHYSFTKNSFGKWIFRGIQFISLAFVCVCVCVLLMYARYCTRWWNIEQWSQTDIFDCVHNGKCLTTISLEGKKSLDFYCFLICTVSVLPSSQGQALNETYPNAKLRQDCIFSYHIYRTWSEM